MRRFGELYHAIDSTQSTNAKVAAMVKYFKETPPSDAAWAVFFLSGRRLLRLIPAAVLREALRQSTGHAEWLIEESYAVVGDLAETIALLLPSGEGETEDVSLETWVTERLMPLREMDPESQKAKLQYFWRALGTREIFLVNKLITGAFRTGVSQSLVVRALSRLTGETEALIAQRLMGNWQPSAEFFTGLISKGESRRDPGVPYTFFLASPLENEPAELGESHEWLGEWKWDGIRAQGIRREGGVFLWSRGEELITERFPELTEVISRLPQGTVIDGEILAFTGDEVQPFAALQKRIGRKKLTPKVLADIPVVYMLFDLLEWDGKDLRESPLSRRREELEKLVDKMDSPRLRVSPRVSFGQWDELGELRDQSRERRVEGLMLKRLSSPYRSGRRRGDWWKWKIAPYTMDAVLLYAQPGHGRRATLYTDYTFGIWKGEELVPIAKAYSGLTDAEILEMDRWIRRHTLEKFGPVRKVEAHHVFELAFEAIQESSRHKAGIAVRFPRILRIRDDKKPRDADTVERVRGLAHAV